MTAANHFANEVGGPAYYSDRKRAPDDDWDACDHGVGFGIAHKTLN